MKLSQARIPDKPGRYHLPQDNCDCCTFPDPDESMNDDKPASLSQTVTWVPVSERLPEIGGTYHVACEGSFVATATYNSHDRWWRMGRTETKPTHWAAPLKHPSELPETDCGNMDQAREIARLKEALIAEQALREQMRVALDKWAYVWRRGEVEVLLALTPGDAVRQFAERVFRAGHDWGTSSDGDPADEESAWATYKAELEKGGNL